MSKACRISGVQMVLKKSFLVLLQIQNNLFRKIPTKSYDWHIFQFYHVLLLKTCMVDKSKYFYFVERKSNLLVNFFLSSSFIANFVWVISLATFAKSILLARRSFQFRPSKILFGLFHRRLLES